MRCAVVGLVLTVCGSFDAGAQTYFSLKDIGVVAIDTASGPTTYRLPDVPQGGVLVQDATGHAGANPITVTSGTTINGNSTYTIALNYGSALFVYMGTIGQ